MYAFQSSIFSIFIVERADLEKIVVEVQDLMSSAMTLMHAIASDGTFVRDLGFYLFTYLAMLTLHVFTREKCWTGFLSKCM